jgi:hydrogenase/urease accessory protein HupE
MTTSSFSRARVGHSLPVGAVLTTLLLLGTPSPAFAHGIGSEASSASIPGFVGIGIEHMLLGWDHLLFVAGILMLAQDFRRAAKVISAFVVGHSLTLIVATLAGWQVSPTLVDVVIVLSVIFVGAYGMVGRPQRWRLFTAIVLAFGLVHGLGLSTRFQDLGVPEDGMVWRLIAFNIGIEIGQLTAIFGMVAVAGVLASALGRHRERAVTTAFLALFLVAAIAAPLVAYSGLSQPDLARGEVAAADGADCEVDALTSTFPFGGGHTEKPFFEPDEEAPLADLGHSLGDGYVVVLYEDDLAESEVSALREYVATAEPAGVLAGSSDVEDGKVKALTSRYEMTCGSLDVDELKRFSKEWFDSIGATA